jgi:hypothetical protein
MSYRLIFGQDEASWKEYKKLKVQRHQRTKQRLHDHDPLLDRLCGQNWRKEAKFFDEINSFDAAYLPSKALPYLGVRLLRVQNFSRAQNPQSWTILWHDRRDLCKLLSVTKLVCPPFRPRLIRKPKQCNSILFGHSFTLGC